MDKIQKLLEHLTPEAALAKIAAASKKLLPAVSEEGRLEFVKQIIGGAGDDKTASMVHL